MSVVCLRGAGYALVFLLMLGGCNAKLDQSQYSSGPTPFAGAACQVAEADRIPGASVPPDLGVYLGCVSNSGGTDQRQAAGWLRDWTLASACMPSCALDRFDGLANKRLRDSLHYILAVTLPAEGVSESCAVARRNLRTHIDETSNLILGWKPNAALTCSVDKRRRAAEASRNDFFKSFDGTLGKIEQFQKNL